MNNKTSVGKDKRGHELFIGDIVEDTTQKLWGDSRNCVFEIAEDLDDESGFTLENECYDGIPVVNPRYSHTDLKDCLKTNRKLWG